MNKIIWIVFGAVVVIGLGVLIFLTQRNNPRVDVASLNTNVVLSASDSNGQIGDHVLGDRESRVVLVEYGDFQCPSCGGAHPQVKAVTEEYGDRIAFVYRNFPLTTIHPNARAAAAAAEAAGLQGKYWEMHDVLFENQDAWENQNTTERTNTFTRYAEQVGINVDTFLTDISSTAINQKISFDQALARRQTVDSTPTFFINGDRVSTEITSALVQGDAAPLKAALDAAIERQ